MVVLILIVLGLCLGSFVNAVVWRLYMQEELAERSHRKGAKRSKAQKKTPSSTELSITRGRSMCSHCYHELTTKDLVPVVSWLLLRGRCRYCGKFIQDTPLPELSVPVLFVLSYAYWPMQFHGLGLFAFVLWLLFLTAFVALALYDIRWFLLPDRIVYPLVALAAVQAGAAATIFGGGWGTLLNAAWGAIIIAGLFYLLFTISKGAWIGFGDVKLAIGLGLLAGGALEAILLIFIASVLGSLVAIPLLLWGRARATTHVPFGPFLLAATVVVVLFGNNIAAWYANLFYIGH